MEGRVQLLYVDDDENDCILISESLHQLCDQCVLSCAATPEQALHRLTWTRGTESFPHLVITDGSLRSGGGSTGLIGAIHEQYPLLPVLVFSGNPMQERVDQFYAAGANGFLYKGIGMEDFSMRLAQLLNHWTKMLILPSRPT